MEVSTAYAAEWPHVIVFCLMKYTCWHDFMGFQQYLPATSGASISRWKLYSWCLNQLVVPSAQIWMPTSGSRLRDIHTQLCAGMRTVPFWRAPFQYPIRRLIVMTSYGKILWSLEAARLLVWIILSLWNLTGASAAVLPRCLSKFQSDRTILIPISWLRDFTRSYHKTCNGYWNGARMFTDERLFGL